MVIKASDHVPNREKCWRILKVWKCVLKQEGEETGDPETSYTKLIAVHAGLESKLVDNQIQILQSKDTNLPRIEPLAGRKNVWNTPPVSSPSHSPYLFHLLVRLAHHQITASPPGL